MWNAFQELSQWYITSYYAGPILLFPGAPYGIAMRIKWYVKHLEQWLAHGKHLLRVSYQDYYYSH